MDDQSTTDIPQSTPKQSTTNACEISTTGEKYNLRRSSLVNRVQSENKRGLPKQPKPKTRPPPLSKYRRKTANHRERERMKDMNDAFELLRKSLPTSDETSEKQTKVTTLKQAMNYITALRRILGYELDSVDSDSASMSRGSDCSASPNATQCDVTLMCDSLNSDGESSSPSFSCVSSGDESYSPSLCGVSGDESSCNLDLMSSFGLDTDLSLDFDVDDALML